MVGAMILDSTSQVNQKNIFGKFKRKNRLLLLRVLTNFLTWTFGATIEESTKSKYHGSFIFLHDLGNPK